MAYNEPRKFTPFSKYFFLSLNIYIYFFYIIMDVSHSKWVLVWIVVFGDYLQLFYNGLDFPDYFKLLYFYIIQWNWRELSIWFPGKRLRLYTGCTARIRFLWIITVTKCYLFLMFWLVVISWRKDRFYKFY